MFCGCKLLVLICFCLRGCWLFVADLYCFNVAVTVAVAFALAVVAVAIMLGNYFKSQQPEFETWIKGGLFDPQTFVGMAIISLIGFTASFLMGSSGKFIAFAVLTFLIS